MKNQDIHLNEDQIIRATVDENDLTTSEQNHLSKCSICQKEKQEFEQVLIRMGDMSQELAPSPRRRFILTSQKSRSSFRWQPALATGFVIVLLMMGIWWSPLFERFQENASVQIVQKMESDQQFVAEITLVEDYALPDRYLDIIGTSDEYDYDNYGDYNDYDDYYDDEFLEFVLPL
jgi:hypothetical protein